MSYPPRPPVMNMPPGPMPVPYGMPGNIILSFSIKILAKFSTQLLNIVN